MEILLISFGWVLGVLSPLITDRISIYLQKKKIRSGFKIELSELRIRLAFLSFRMTTKFGNLNTDFLIWFRKQVEDITTKKEWHEELEVSIDDLISNDKSRQSFISDKKGESRNAVSARKYSLPFIESKLHFIQYFDADYSRKILEIFGHIHSHNELVDEARWFFHETFSINLTTENRDIIHSNLDRVYEIIGQRARAIATEITSI